MMSFNFSLTPRKSRPSRGRREHPRLAGRRRPLTLEQLESRTVLSAYSAASAADLIADINAANTAGGANTITLAATTASPYLLTAVDNTTDGATGLPVIAAGDSLTIVGNGDTIERSTAAGTLAFRLLDVAAGASLIIQSLTLQGGLAMGAGISAEGGAIYSQGALALSGVSVQDNQAVGIVGAPQSSSHANPGGDAFGGGLYVAGGTAALNNATLSSNIAEGGRGCLRYYGPYSAGAGGNGFGGGLEVAGGMVTLSNDTLSSNAAQGGESGRVIDAPLGDGGNGYGGALQVTGGTVSVSSSTLSFNTASGGIGLNGPGPDGGNGYGGAMQASGGAVSLTGTTLSANTAEGRGGNGGAVQVNSGTVSLNNAILSINTAQGGFNASTGGFGFSAGGYGEGGALQVSGGSVSLTGATTLSSNTAAGGYGWWGGSGDGGALQVSGGTVSLTGAILSSNTAQAGSGYGDGGTANGGALQVSNGTLILATVTLSSNTAQGGDCASGENGDAGSGDGGALQVSGGAVSVTNATVSSNTALGGTPNDDGGSGAGGGLDLGSGGFVYLDSTTVAHVRNNTDSTGLNGTSANIVGAFSLFNESLQPPTVVTAASAAPARVVGTTSSLSVLGSDPDNGTESDLTYNWTYTSGPEGGATFSSNGTNASKNTTVTFHEAGTYTFQATLTDSYHLTAVSSVTVTVDQTLTSVSVTPASVTLPVNGQQHFQAAELDQFGNKMAAQPTAFTWSIAKGGVGTINENGLYTAPKSGTGRATIQATANGITGIATVTIA